MELLQNDNDNENIVNSTINVLPALYSMNCPIM